MELLSQTNPNKVLKRYVRPSVEVVQLISRDTILGGCNTHSVTTGAAYPAIPTCKNVEAYCITYS